jgi:hypothetical protein
MGSKDIVELVVVCLETRQAYCGCLGEMPAGSIGRRKQILEDERAMSVEGLSQLMRPLSISKGSLLVLPTNLTKGLVARLDEA